MEEVVKELGKEDIEIVKIEDIGEIVNRGVMMTPGLVIDEQVKIAGKIPSVEQIKTWIQESN